jgi:hypothetical protein
MKVYELIEKLSEMPQLADVNIVFDAGFASRDIESIYICYDDYDPVVCIDESEMSRATIME